MQPTTIKEFLANVYLDPKKYEEWLANPHEKTKEWKYEIDEKTIDVLKITLEFISQEFKMGHVTQHTIKKFNQTSRHSIISFYTTLGMHVLSFAIGVALLGLGLYAFFGDRSILGVFLSMIGFAQIIYFLIAKPLQSLNENIGNLIQVEVALSSFLNEMTYWQVYLWETKIAEKQIVAQAMRDASKWVIMLIEDYTGPNKRSAIDPDKYGEMMEKTRLMLEKLRKSKEKPEKYLTSGKETDATTPTE